MRFHLSHVDWTGSLTVGPGGPLVRFDQSNSPSSFSARTAARQRRSTPANGGSSRAPDGRDGSARPGRSSRWSLGRRGWRESPAASSAAEEASGGFWGSGLQWFPIAYERLGSSARLRGVEWCRWMGGGGSGCDARHRNEAEATLIGDGEESFPPSIAGRGNSREVA